MAAPQRILMEVCVDSVASVDAVLRAHAALADVEHAHAQADHRADASEAERSHEHSLSRLLRLELCDSLVEGGITPSFGKIQAVMSRVRDAADRGTDEPSIRASRPRVGVHVLIRPRGGDFCYTEDEVEVMCADIRACVGAGVDGVVIGALTPDGELDIAILRRLMDAGALDPCSSPRPRLRFTLHRCIDMSRVCVRAITQAMELGFDYILTSGHAPSVAHPDARRVIATAVAMTAGSKTTIVAGGGVDEESVIPLVAETGVREIHGTARAYERGRMTFVPEPLIYMGAEKRNVPEVELGVKVAQTSLIQRILRNATAAATPLL